MPAQQILLGASSGGLTKGQWYPMFGFENNDAADSNANQQPPSSGTSFNNMELQIRRALSFDTSNTTALDGTETISQVVTIIDANRYTCNPLFASGGENIDGFKIKHVDINGNTYDEAYCLFDGSAFNIYDHACNAATNLNFNLPSQMGSVTAAYINSSSVATTNVYVNCSSLDVRTGGANWATDGGDYCFLGISDKHHTAPASDAFDGTSFATNDGLAFGLSDSDGVPTNSQPPNTGISRRNVVYSTLMANKQEAGGTKINHCGDCVTGFFIVEGRVK